MEATKKMPWEAYPQIWKSEAAFMSWLRGGIRGGLWNKHPRIPPRRTSMQSCELS